MIGFVARGKPGDEDLARFAPRVTLTLLAGFAIFLISAGLYVLPALLEPVPPGAIPDYRKERVIARLDGKVPYFLLGSFVGATLLSIRGWLPGTSRRNRP